MAKASRNELFEKKLPGAGQYEDQSPSVKHKMPSFRMSLKTESLFDKKLRKDNFPGPANYNPYKTSLSNIKYSIPKELRKSGGSLNK